MMPVTLVGRAAALDDLHNACARVREGREPVSVLVTGDQGTGKSSLVAEFLRTQEPIPVLSGAARVHSPAPYDWLAAVLADRDIRDIGVPGDALAWLKQDPDVPRERYTPDALLRLAVTAVRALVGGRPAVLVVEDLHALDPASLNLIAELASPGAALPALLLVTSRPPEAAVSPDLTSRTMARLAGGHGAVRRHLGALRQAEVGKILEMAYGEPPVPELIAAVWRRTEGNPYRVRELIAVEGADGPEALMTRRPDLTAREREVLGCLAAGMANKQIAAVLGISVRTVTVHVSNLLRKTGAGSRTEAALWAVRNGAVPHRVARDLQTASASSAG
ncbi:LuxR family transcriptional regulator [Actinoplanes sp. OR16]|uniref:helix-turn-helix transcriptional regulator n=1 Tax=Actinoplanes sp. OR16 TaxID=946334 RepID=UPI000FDAE692|nr:LuxR family transcriptional regulator [Actinoplanes sp. OR16]